MAPIDHVRGSLCAKSVLAYNSDSGRAWDSASAIAEPAAYQPIMIASRRKASGVRYYWIKAHTRTNFTEDNRLAIAAFSAACSKYYAILRDTAAANTLRKIYSSEVRNVSLRAYTVNALRTLFAYGYGQTVFSGGGQSLTVYNDFKSQTAVACPLPANVISKFTEYLTI